MTSRRVVSLALLLAAASATASPAAEVQAPPKHFLVLLRLGPGYDRALPIREQKGFPAHAAYMNDLEQKGKVVFGGPLLESFASMQPTGAALVVQAETPEEARQIAAGDPSGMLEVQEVRAFLLAIAPNR